MTNLLPDIKIVIADDHEIFRDGLSLMLGKYPEIQIAGEAQNGLELVEMVKEHKPHVILTDIKMPVMDGIEAVKKIIAADNDAAIICLSMFDEDDLILDMIEAGVKGYLLKNSDKAEIIDAITTVYHGNYYYSKTTSHKMINMIAKSRFNPYSKSKRPDFSEREIEIIHLICSENSNKEIGEKLFLSSRTVEGHRQRIMEKMAVKNSIGLVIYALKNELVKL
ncbi:MAG: response regulator transcription factor [Parafilimonas sp.]